MKFIVSTDAAADLDVDYIKQNDVKVISMKFLLKDTEYTFGNGEPCPLGSELFNQLKKGTVAKSMLINTEEHIAHFEPFLSKGLNILHIPLSSGLSGTADNAKLAAEQLSKKYPNAKIVVFDFKGASLGQGLFVDYLVQMRNKGKTLEEAVDWANENALKLCHYFTVNDLGHLRRGGRISGFASFIGSLLSIKPLLHVNNDGKLIPLRKVMGRSKALNSLTVSMKTLSDSKEQRVFICHADCEDDAKIVAKNITEEFGITDIKIGMMGPIIGLHAGPGTVALFFMGKNR